MGEDNDELFQRLLSRPSYLHMTALILYTTEDGHSQIKLRAKDQTVWLTQREMAQLFDVSTDNVGLHLKNIFADGELDAGSVTEESSVTAADGKNYLTKLYNLDAILAVGYRVEARADELYLQFDQARKRAEAIGADQHDKAERT